ncbi:uncharacterized protein LOC122646324 [Telopea speciosissima]|uniref:uncharacterized protein LOC122646324 n=1 Tax=Telopea speciosissima TaxID=54955 RepID=UPI001CC34AD7|nr:uncharacterized protein LOC122646324 [Telopea speciosissima]
MKTTESFHVADTEQQLPPDPRKRNRSCAARSALICLLILIILFITILILAFTVFKPKDPTTEILSTTVDGILPQVQFPQFKVELNITLNLQILVHNTNQASFKHGTDATALVYYHGTQVAVAEILPGTIPANGYETIASRLTLEADQFMSQISELIKDVMAGEIEVETKATVPGRVKFLGIFHKHVVSVSNCRIVIGISDLKIRRQECNYGIKY